jgi:hypothetical protein
MREKTKKVIIEITEEMYNKLDNPIDDDDLMRWIIKNGKVIPDDHGRIVDINDVLVAIVFSDLFDDVACGKIKEVLQKTRPLIYETEPGTWIYDKVTDKSKCDKCGAYCPSDNLGRIETYYCPNCGDKKKLY